MQKKKVGIDADLLLFLLLNGLENKSTMVTAVLLKENLIDPLVVD